MKNKLFYQRKLPHIHPGEGTFFITYRLYGSIPKSVIRSIHDNYKFQLLQLEKEFPTINNQQHTQASTDLEKKLLRIFKKKKYNLGKMSFKEFDDYLDANLNEPYWLQNEEIAQLNLDALIFYDANHYKLWAATIMSNHIHLLFTLLPKSPPLWKIMKNIKSYTGKEGNRILGRIGKGKFWEEESYDRFLRKGEFEPVLWYILNNPVKANLVDDWEKWRWTYCHPSLLD